MFVYYFGWGLVEPFLPIYFNGLFGSYTSVGIIISLLYFFSIFLSLPFGDLSDRVSKKAIITAMLFLYIPIGPLLSVVRTVAHATLFRLYHAFLATGLWASTEAYVRSHSPRRQSSESMGLFDVAISGAVVCGAITGGLLIGRFGIETLFYIMPVFSIGALVILLRLPDSDGSFSFVAGVKDLLRHKLFRHELRDFFSIPGIAYMTSLSFLFNAVGGAVAVLLPLVYNAFGVSLWEIGLIYALFMMPGFFEGPFSVIADHVHKRMLLMIGAGVSVVVLSMMLYADSIGALFILSLCLGIVFALLRPLIEGMVTNCMPHNHVGELNGVYRAFVLLALAIGSFIIGPIADAFTIQAPFLIGALLMCLFLVLVFLIPRAVFAREK